MGKVLVIPNSDFSDNSVKTINLNPTLVWGVDGTANENNATDTANVSVSPFVPVDYENIQNKTVRKIRLVPKVAGTVSVMLSPALGQSGELVQTLTITPEMVLAGTPVDFDVFIKVGNKVIMFSKSTDTGAFAFYVPRPAVTGLADFYMNADASYSRANSGQELCISIGYYV